MDQPSFLVKKTFFQRVLETVDHPQLVGEMKSAAITGDYSAVKEIIEGEISGLVADKAVRLSEAMPENRMAITIENGRLLRDLQNLLTEMEILERVTNAYLAEFEGSARYKAIVEILKADRSGDYSVLFDLIEDVTARKNAVPNMVVRYLNGFEVGEPLNQAFDEVARAKETGDFTHIEEVLAARQEHEGSMKSEGFLQRMKGMLINMPGGRNV